MGSEPRLAGGEERLRGAEVGVACLRKTRLVGPELGVVGQRGVRGGEGPRGLPKEWQRPQHACASQQQTL